MDALVGLAAEISKSFVVPVGRQFGYLFHFRRKLEELSRNMEDLESNKEDIQRRIDAATNGGEHVHSVVKRWLQKVDKIQIQVNQLSGKADEINGWFKGWCCARYSLGRKAFKKIGDVIELINERKSFSAVSDPAPSSGPGPGLEIIPVEGFEIFNSTAVAKEQVMQALKNDETNIIGVHGMGGIGKTILMKHVANIVKKSKLFDVVVMVTVSQNPKLKEIQDEIAENFGLKLEQGYEKPRASRLFERLQKEKRVLIILDDLWSRLEMGEVGIPAISCKVVITTRRLEVCRVMKTQANIPLEFLSEKDSWDLFQKNAGNVVESVDLIDVAKEVANECKGLPIALVTLGSAMRDNHDKYVWQDVLQQLRESDFTDIEDMDARVYKPIKLSYDYLPSKEIKYCFLFCCLFPEDHEISVDELLRYVMGESILKDVVKLKPAMSRLRSRMLDKLISSCMLLKGDKDGYVVMHDIVRDVAIEIAKREHGFIVRAGWQLEPWPEKEKLGECKRLSLMGSGISELPYRPECPNILTLSLSRCQSLKEIPDKFFEGMKSLVTLDLSYTRIQSLPSSLSDLVNLRSLCLDNCSALKDASLIGELKNLEIICMRRTSIRRLPEEEMKKFANLKWLAVES